MRRRKKNIFKLFLLGFLLLVAVFSLQAAKYLPIFWQFAFNKKIELHKSNNRINILLLGIGGGTHDGPNLTDTIIFASINPEKKTVSLVSVPRDLWVPDLKAKINTAYAYGEEKKKGAGLILAKAVVGKVVGEPIDYALRLDFSGFVKAVDMVGGLDIQVDRSFDDYEYPITGAENELCGHTASEAAMLATASSQLDAFPCRYEHLSFKKGLQHMDGITALKFVRSRHALGPEGTDFARSKRQEKVILAFEQKLFSANTLLNPLKIINLLNIFKNSIDTDIKTQEIDDFVKLAEKMKKATLKSYVIDAGDEIKNRPGLLVNPANNASEYNYEWVLIPRIGNGNFSEIHNFVTCAISAKECLVPSPTP